MSVRCSAKRISSRHDLLLSVCAFDEGRLERNCSSMCHLCPSNVHRCMAASGHAHAIRQGFYARQDATESLSPNDCHRIHSQVTIQAVHPTIIYQFVLLLILNLANPGLSLALHIASPTTPDTITAHSFHLAPGSYFKRTDLTIFAYQPQSLHI